MDMVLVVVAVVSLVLASALAVVSWKLLRDSRERSAARVAALEALAYTDDGLDVGLAAPAPPLRPEAASRPASRFVDVLDVLDAPDEPDVLDVPEAFEEEDDWDLRYRPEAEVYADARPELDRPHQRETRADRYAPIAVSDSMFSPEPPRAPSRRWAALATVAIVVGGGAATIYGLRSDAMSRLSGQISLPSFAAASAGQRAPLELLSLRHAAERSGAFTVTGLVQNPLAGNAVSDVVAVVYLFDREGRYFTSGKVALPSGLAPGEEAPFVISIDDARGVGRYRVGFRLENGGVVAHVDRRGQEPAGTTGDTVEESGPAAAVPTSTRGRVEGN